jgi:hypothetical protein
MATTTYIETDNWMIRVKRGKTVIVQLYSIKTNEPNAPELSPESLGCKPAKVSRANKSLPNRRLSAQRL